ncbi:MAG: glycosyl transferase [Betaproteobacteria bacterium HGW-Betaproteobacteria-12]|nr:MAG: glycosyl transferase [Betaproteobacteria bacterium HGW-Betaproteobacteria-12]
MTPRSLPARQAAAAIARRCAIVIPMLDEGADIATLLAGLQAWRAAGCEIIVVDGGSRDASLALAKPLATAAFAARRGRSRQMNAGAAQAQNEILIFLHADTRLPPDALAHITTAIDDGACWGRFDVRIDGRLPGLAMVATLMNWRSRLTGIATGDQALFVSREVFERIGGFPEQPLMEDIALSRTLRALSWPTCLRQRVTTSGRRWEQRGLWRTIFAMWWLRLRYFCGARPADLARDYGYAPDEN